MRACFVAESAARESTLLYMNIIYPSDLTDTEWECMQQYLLDSRSDCRTRRHSLRRIRERDLLCPPYWLSLALLAEQFPTVANRLLSFSPRLPCEDDGLYCSRHYTTRNVSGWAGILTPALPSWMPSP
jgi:hypothetical protein